MKCEECGKKIRMVLWLEVGHDPECPRYDFKDAPERIEIKVTREETERDEARAEKQNIAETAIRLDSVNYCQEHLEYVNKKLFWDFVAEQKELGCQYCLSVELES